MNKNSINILLLSLSVTLMHCDGVISKTLKPDSENERFQYIEKSNSWLNSIRPSKIRIDGPVQEKNSFLIMKWWNVHLVNQ